MSPRSYLFSTARAGLAVALGVCAMSHAVAAGPSADEAAFMAANDTAMSKMMKDMAVKPSGDVDEDFVAMMQPHHQGAIEMAEAELRYGHNEELRRIAQELIRQQKQEIVAMQAALKSASRPPAPPLDQPDPGRPEVSHKNMKMDGAPGS